MALARAVRAFGLLCVAVGATFFAAAVLGRFVLHGPVDGHRLRVSVVAASGSSDALFGTDAASCARRSAGEWTCTVADREGSGGTVVYRVRTGAGSSCWRGRLDGGSSSSGDMPRRIHGCVRLWQWSLL